MLGQPGYRFLNVRQSSSDDSVGIGLQKGVEQSQIHDALLFSSDHLGGKLDALKAEPKDLSSPDFELRPDGGGGSGQCGLCGVNQAFFTLSLGIGAISIFGSYTSDNYRLTGESIRIICLDTFVALLAGLIIFPAAFAFNIEANAGPSLLFITLPNIFNQMRGGRFWGALFFLFMSFAALSTVIAVFENIVSYWMDVLGSPVGKHRSSMACNDRSRLAAILGFNVFASFSRSVGKRSLGSGRFHRQLNILPISAFIISIYTSWRYGWGWDNFIAEADKGTEGAMFPKIFKPYFKYGLPLVVIVLWLLGYVDIFGA